MMWQTLRWEMPWVLPVGLFAFAYFIYQAVLGMEGGVIVTAAWFGAAMVSGLGAAAAWMGRKRRYGTGPTVDERERVIRRRGDAAGFWTLFAIFTLVCMVPWLIVSLEGGRAFEVEVKWLPALLALASIAQSLVRELVMWWLRDLGTIHADE